MVDEYKNIENLLERFFDGLTSNEEEQQLYDFFSETDIPEHLRKYIPVFNYFETGIIDETKEEKIEIIPIELKKQRRESTIYWGLGIAASVLLIFSFYFGFVRDSKDFDRYEGSYIVQNGVRITDPDLIRGELERAEREALERQKEAMLLLQNVSKTSDNYGHLEKELIQRHYGFIEDIPDENIRKIIKENLN